MYKMKVLGIDPSSTTIGLAVINEQGKLLEASLIKPNKASDPWIVRVMSMISDLEAQFRKYWPDYVAIETPASHVAGRIGKAQGLAIYGFAAGAAWMCAKGYSDNTDVPVKTYDAQEWTGRTKKEHRAIVLAMRRPEYKAIMDARPKKDPGFDVADAIQLAEICLKEIQIEARLNYVEHKAPSVLKKR